MLKFRFKVKDQKWKKYFLIICNMRTFILEILNFVLISSTVSEHVNAFYRKVFKI